MNMYRFQRGRVVVGAVDPLDVSADALVVTVGGDGPETLRRRAMAASPELEAAWMSRGERPEPASPVILEAPGLRAERVVFVAERGPGDEARFERALEAAFSAGAISIALPLPSDTTLDDAALAVASVAAFIDAHPALEQVTLAAASERALAAVLAVAGEYL
jgi:uncharacterized protein (DUF736 family)